MGESERVRRRVDRDARTEAPGRKRGDGEPSAHGGMLALQRQVGNQALLTVQRKALVGAVDDPLEREADRIAARVVAGATAPTISRAPGAVQRWPWSKKKKKPEISGPTNVRKMTWGEQGGVMSNAQLVKGYERKKKDDEDTGESVEGVSEMVEEAELEAEREPKRQMALSMGQGGGIEDSDVEGVSDLFVRLSDIVTKLFEGKDKPTVPDLQTVCDAASQTERDEVYADKALVGKAERVLGVRDYLKFLGLLRVVEQPTTGMLAEGGGAKGGHTKAETADDLIQDKMQAYVADAVKAGKRVAGQVAIVNDADFRKAYLDEYGPDDHDVDGTNAFVRTRGDDGLIVIHQDRGNAGTTIHEGMHKYSDESLQGVVDFDFNEGVTEFFTREITDNLPKKIARGNYQNQYLIVDQLVTTIGSKDKLAKAYFNGQLDPFFQAIIDKGRTVDDIRELIAAMQDHRWMDAYELAKPPKKKKAKKKKGKGGGGGKGGVKELVGGGGGGEESGSIETESSE